MHEPLTTLVSALPIELGGVGGGSIACCPSGQPVTCVPTYALASGTLGRYHGDDGTPGGAG